MTGKGGAFTFDHRIKTYVLDGEHRLAGSLDLNGDSSRPAQAPRPPAGAEVMPNPDGGQASAMPPS